MQARGYLDNRLKYCWPKVIYCIVFYCICQPVELKREIKKKTGGANGRPSKNLGVMAHLGPP